MLRGNGRASQDMDWEAVIGLEVHAQLLTRSKMFCSCPAEYMQGAPNTRVCPVCLGMPGTLPVINQQAVEFVMMTGLALNCNITDYTQFDRKNYPYPDLMKGYQISQYANPIAHGGWLELDLDGDHRRVGITRVHLEEDVAKLQHVRVGAGEAYSLVDVNRSGVPLMETVSEPDMRSPEEARQYLTKLHSILQYLEVSTGDMEKGAFRCDANVSVRPKGADELSAKVEVKNMNSFRSVYRALQYEMERQVRVLEEGGRVVQETRGWVEERGVTVSQRTKEFAHDYRYFPEPDLPPLHISREWVEEVQVRLPELPDARRDRYMAQYGLSHYDASLLTASKELADYFEASLEPHRLEGKAPLTSSEQEQGRRAKAVANWLTGEMARLLNQSGMDITEVKVTPAHLVDLVDLVEEGTVGSTQAKVAFEEMFQTGKSPRDVVTELGLAQVTDTDAVLPAVEQAIAENEQAASDYLSGKETAIRFLVGQVMKLTRGKANPNLVNDLLRERLEALKGQQK